MAAGIMVFISLDELLPTAEKYGKHHIAMYGLAAGMIVMAASLVLFARDKSRGKNNRTVNDVHGVLLHGRCHEPNL